MLGASSKGVWLIKTSSGVQPVGGSSLVALLPLLEHQKPEVDLELRSAVVAKGLPIEMLGFLPLEDLVVVALKSKSDYWQNLALQWITRPVPVRVIACLECLETEGATQKVRHAARRLLHTGTIRRDR